MWALRIMLGGIGVVYVTSIRGMPFATKLDPSSIPSPHPNIPIYPCWNDKIQRTAATYIQPRPLVRIPKLNPILPSSQHVRHALLTAPQTCCLHSIRDDDHDDDAAYHKKYATNNNTQKVPGWMGAMVSPSGLRIMTTHKHGRRSAKNNGKRSYKQVKK